MDDRITDLQAKLFVEEDKLRRLSDIYNTFAQTTTQELTKLREKTEKSLFSQADTTELAVTPPRVRMPYADLRKGVKVTATSGPPSPRGLMVSDLLDISTMELSAREARKAIEGGSAIASIVDPEIRLKFAQIDELRIRMERLEADTQQLWPRLALDEADAQQLHLTTEALKWEREKDMENFYLFQV
jgi:hypothetical protein